MDRYPLAFIHARALRLHDAKATARIFTEEFTLIELIHLWFDYCMINSDNPDGQCYDDEIYDALEMKGYFNYV
jgi:hypothetical protein